MRLAPSKSGRGFRFQGCGTSLRVAATIVSFGAALATPAQVVNPAKPPDVPKPAQFEGYATWYKVPGNSRTKRRAGKDDLTAAHNRLPYGSRVRVTHLGNGKSVIVRITDRVVSHHSVIDLSEEAATKLEMIHEGSAHVRVEILPDEKLPVSKTKTPPW
jgi:rare lipoprotein A